MADRYNWQIADSWGEGVRRYVLLVNISTEQFRVVRLKEYDPRDNSR